MLDMRSVRWTQSAGSLIKTGGCGNVNDVHGGSGDGSNWGGPRRGRRKSHR